MAIIAGAIGFNPQRIQSIKKFFQKVLDDFAGGQHNSPPPLMRNAKNEAVLSDAIFKN
ncbi:hypothetical protein Bsp3421_000784 [Burkholderia sp. FERM BP-3421]|uniref:hypothetical protein n=1 Tax=Burkholderia sp. FERM BP-3421 TaxID=1494466 RepID=UPI00235FD29F|nr:hypothetical protein [Burkholderia sp. FERM BP-3421]WDD90900.1 hypothetical protein Bsp3421_000784 [Burkholderia sp. FERM BP-3421]